MTKHSPFTLIYAPVVRQHILALDAKYDSLIHDAVARQLKFQPDVVTRNRKPLRQPAAFHAEWELVLARTIAFGYSIK